MRKATFLLLTVLLCVYIMPLPVHAQEAEPTIIYLTEFEDDPGVAGDEYYGNDTHWTGEEWGAACGVDATGCIYTPENEVSGDDALALIDYAQNPLDVDLTGNPAPEGCVINFVEFDLYYRTDTEGGTDVSEIYVVGDDDGTAGIITPVTPNDYSFRDDFDIAGLPGAVEGEFFHVGLSLSNTEVMDSWAIRWAIVVEDIPGDPPVYDLEVRVDNLVVWCDHVDEENLIRPIDGASEHDTWAMFDWNLVAELDPEYSGAIEEYEGTNGDDVYAFSDNYGANVYAAAPGVVESIDVFTPDNCSYFGNARNRFLSWLVGGDPACYTVVPQPISGNNNGIAIITGDYLYRFDTVDAYKVVVVFGEQRIGYIVANADEYLEENQSVEGGCILGETIRLIAPATNEIIRVNSTILESFWGQGELGVFFTEPPPTNAGIAFLHLYDPAEMGSDRDQRLLPMLTEYPDPSNPPCNRDPRYAACQGDAELKNPEEWQVSGAVSWSEEGGVVLEAGASITAHMGLSEGTPYSMTVNALMLSSPTNTSTLTLQLGQTISESTITANAGIIASYTIPLDEHEPDLLSVWTVGVTNTTGKQIRINSICVTDGEPNEVRNGCYFNNHSFDFGTSGWTVESEGDVQVTSGALLLPFVDDPSNLIATLSQNVDVTASGTTTLDLIVELYLWYRPGYDPTGNTDNKVTVNYDWDGESGDVEFGGNPNIYYDTFAYRQLVTGQSPGIVIARADFSITADHSGDFVLEIGMTRDSSEVLGVGIASICLQGIFNDDDSYTGGNQSCGAITPPTGNQLSDWISYLWSQFNRFHQCDLMVALRTIQQQLFDTHRLIGWSIRWTKATIAYEWRWMGTNLIPWANSHFRNIAMGNVAVVYSNSQNGANLFDFLIQFFSGGGTGLFDVLNNIVNSILAPIVNVLLGIIGAVAFVLLEVIVEIVGVAFNLFNTSVNLIGTMFSMFYGLISAWNSATPTAIPGVPMCGTDPQASTFCMLLWAAEHTVFSGVGSLWIPLIIAFGAAKVILWSVREFKKTLVDTGAMM